MRDALPTWEGLKQCNDLSPHLINAALEDIRKIRGNHEELESNGSHQLQVYADMLL
jgi:hypothetical protein